MSKIIKFFDPQKELIDSVNAEYEDSFCLETFSDLISSHEELGKSFVIARVQTCDPKQPEKVHPLSRTIARTKA
jgi:hypothetical protein